MIRVYTARFAGLGAGLGLLMVAASGDRWATGSMGIPARYFRGAFVTFLAIWLISGRLIRAPIPSVAAI